MIPPPPKTREAERRATGASGQVSAPRQTPFYVPPILLEGDEPQRSPLEIVSRKSRRIQAQLRAGDDLEVPGALPEPYGTGCLFLVMRDPHCLYAHWDLAPEEQRRYNGLAAGKHLTLRLHRNSLAGELVSEFHVHPESQHWFVHVGAGGTYVAVLGYYLADGTWAQICDSSPVSTYQAPAPPPAQVVFAVPLGFPREHPPRLEAWKPQPPVAATAGSTVPVGAQLVHPLVPPPPLPQSPSPSPATSLAGPATSVREEALVQPLPPARAEEAPLVEVQAEAVSVPGPQPGPQFMGGSREPALSPAPTFQERAPVAQTTFIEVAPGVAPRRNGEVYPTPPAPSEEVFSATEPWSEAQEQALAELIAVSVAGEPGVRPEGISSLLQQQLKRQISSPAGPARKRRIPGQPGVEVVSSPGGAPPPQAEVQPGGAGFWFNVNAELVVYGATDPSAKVTIGGRPIRLRPDGSFSYRFALPDGDYELVISATSRLGDQRHATLQFRRASAYRGEVAVHPQDPALKIPAAENTE